MFEQQTWWITGASSGIGAALADTLAQKGARLILSGRNEAALSEAAARVRTPCLILPFEATDFPAIPAIVDQAWAWQGRVDGLINNAGISQRSLAVDTAFEVYQRIIDIDLLAPIRLTQEVAPRMVNAGGGDVVAISSVAGIIGAPLRSAYSAAKAGIMAYHDSLRSETAHQGVRVLVVAPGSVRTNVSKNALDGKARTRGVSDPAIDNGMPADAAAQRIVDAIAGGQRELILAEGMELQGALLRRSNPDQVFDLMAKLVESGYAKQLGAED